MSSFAAETSLCKTHEREPLKKFYLGLGTGINCDYGLLGLGLKFRPANQAILSLSGGVGTWGYKTGVNGLFLFKPEGTTFGLGAGLSYASGSPQAVELELQKGAGKSKVYFNSVTLINLMASQQWVFDNGNRLSLDFGYGIPVTNKAWNISSGPNTPDGQRVLDFMKPGGLILSLNFMFGVY